jgi:hypothetical protein
MAAYVFEVESSRTPVAPWPADVEYTREGLGPRARPTHGSVRASSDVSVTGDDDVEATAARRSEKSDRSRGCENVDPPGSRRVASVSGGVALAQRTRDE